jgi:bifunctional non-homologous end joining protein LigD
MARAGTRPNVAGVGISHPERIVFPAIGATKLDLARYYEAIAPWVVPHLADRPLTLSVPAGASAALSAST